MPAQAKDRMPRFSYPTRAADVDRDLQQDLVVPLGDARSGDTKAGAEDGSKAAADAASYLRNMGIAGSTTQRINEASGGTYKNAPASGQKRGRVKSGGDQQAGPGTHATKKQKQGHGRCADHLQGDPETVKKFSDGY